jgi:hypothetical protein
VADISLGAPALSRARGDAVLLLPLLLLGLGYLLRYLAVLWVTGDPDPIAAIGSLCQWDCIWYKGIAEHGYDPFPNVPALIDHGNWAFFPLYPAFVALVQKVVPLPTVLLASLLSSILSLLAAYAARPWFEGRERGFVLFSAFMLAGPFSFYFATFLSEVPFVLLTVIVLVALKRSNFMQAGSAAALLSASRIIAAFIAVSILVKALENHRRAGGRWRDFPRWGFGQGDLVLALVLAPLGAFAYMLFLYLHMGDALAFARVQRAWAREYGNPIDYLWTGLTRFPDPGSSDWLTVSQWLAVAALVGLGLGLVLLLRRQWPEAVFAILAVVIPLCAGLASMIRFVAGLAPASLVLCDLLGRSRAVFWGSLLGFFVLCLLLTRLWVSKYVPLI